MALTVQTSRGDVDSANSYAGLELMKSYHADRGVSLAPFTDDLLSQALVNATDFLDSRYSFIGSPLRAQQGTQCPRYLTDRTAEHFLRDFSTLEPAYLLTTPQWTALVRACCMLAYRHLKKPGGLIPDPTFDATGQKVAKKTTKAGPIETTVEYQDGSGATAVPSYPAVDLMLKNVGLVRSRSSGPMARG
jgi:hypothetical protein